MKRPLSSEMTMLKTLSNTPTKRYEADRRQRQCGDSKSKNRNRIMTLSKIIVAVLLFAGIGAVVLTSRKHLKSRILTDATTADTTEKDNDIKIYPQSRNKKSYVVSNSPAVKGPWQNIQLPRNVIPERYEIDLDVDMDNDRYSGSVRILVKVTGNSVKHILLHKSHINVHGIKVTDANRRTQNVKWTNEYKPNEYLVITMENPLKNNSQYYIETQFNADLRKDLTGFFVTRGGSGSKIAATLLSPISTRKFFPCFDEPYFKATFRVSVTHEVRYNALSNMPEESRTATNTTTRNATKTTFKESLRMSTYMLGLLLADDTYKVVEKRMHGSLAIQVWDFEGSQWNTETNELVALLDYYEKKFFKLPFPLEKLDVAIMPDFIPGATETWGLMMFRVRLSNYHLLAHEIVHQWFGNLATMEFWDVAWIKEGKKLDIKIISLLK